MPTQRFFNLKASKRELIMKAAAHEFSRVPYSAASINQIIKEADISRGSFYTYFEDKEDLLRYLFQGFRDRCKEKIFRVLEQEQGDPFATVCELFHQLIFDGPRRRGFELYKNAFTDISLMAQDQLFGMMGYLYDSSQFKEFIHECYSRVDLERFNIEDEKQMAYLVDMMISMTIKSITWFYKGAVEESRLMEVLEAQMNILKRSVSSAYHNII